MRRYMKAWQNWSTLKGRSSRSDYWWFFLVNLLIGVVLGVLDSVLGLDKAGLNTGLLAGVYSLVALLPGISVGVRRLHDRALSGGWWLIILVPIVGPVILLIMLALPGTPGDNIYGPDPLVQLQG